MSSVTYLSDYVYQIIVKCSETNLNCRKKYISKDLTYDWGEIEDVLGEITDDFEILDQSEAWYLEKSNLIWNVIHEAGSAISATSIEERKIIYQLCEWVDYQPDIFDYTFLHENGEDGVLLPILVMTAAFERALGNVYMTKRYPVPFLLRDLLKTSEIISVFGKVPIVFTQFLVGCPRAINLRNVVWHGFISPGEIHPHLVSGLIVLFASLGKLLLDHQKIPKRPQFSSFDQFQDELKDIFPDIISSCDEVIDMIENSSFIPEKCKIFWKKAYELLQSERYGYSIVLMMPQLEHCLRVLYCRVNDCPDRLLTAESTVFYTTLDEILAPDLSTSVGSGLLMLLLDITSSLSGPRLRDRLSHGEVQLASVPQWLANFVFCVALGTAHSCKHMDHRGDGKHCNISLCSHLQEIISHYHSRFHIVANLRRQLISLLDHWPYWQQCPKPADVVIQPLSCQNILALDKLMFPHGGDVIEKLSRIKECLEDSQLSTLYRPKPELELATALYAVGSCVAQTAGKICNATTSRNQLWCDRRLRSRARATAVRMWSVLPDVWSALLSVLMVVTLCYHQLPYLASQEKHVHRLVKILSKAVENTVTLCDVDKNRWTEAHQILSNLAAMCLQWFTVNSDFVNKVIHN